MALYVDAKMHIAQHKMFHIKTGLPIETSPVFDIQVLFANGLQNPGTDTPGYFAFFSPFLGDVGHSCFGIACCR